VVIPTYRLPEIGGMLRRIDLFNPAETTIKHDRFRLVCEACLHYWPDQLTDGRIMFSLSIHDGVRCLL
jgi:hypothetical protein